jgi:hypothetical protein
MGESKRRRKPAPIIELPIAETEGLTATDIFPTIDAMWGDFAAKPFLRDVTRERRQMTKFAFYTAISEALRTVAFRINADQDTGVFDDFDRELRAFDRELAEEYAAH